MSTTASEPAWQRLHPASLAVNLVPRAWGVLRASWPLLLALLLGRQSETSGFVDLGILSLFFAMTVASTAVHFFTLRFRIFAGHLEIRSGLLHRQVRTIDAARVQNVERTRNVFQRLAGLVEVRIETASGREVEGLLSALTNEQADALISALRKEKLAVTTEEYDADAVTEELLVVNGPADLLRFGATATRWGLALVLAGGAVELLQWTDPARLTGLFRGAGAVAALSAALTGTWVLGIAGAFVSHWGFRLVRHGDGLTAEEGLLTRRSVNLRPGKVQRVSVIEPVLRRLAGFVSVQFETAATSTDQGGTRHAVALVPVVGVESVAGLVQEVLGGDDLDRVIKHLRPAHPRALRRSLLGALVRGLLVGAGLVWWQGPYGGVGFLAVPVFLVLGWLDWKWQGFAVTDELVVARRGWFARQTVLARRGKVQAVSVTQGPLLWRWGLGRVVVQVAGGLVVLPDLAFADAEAIRESLSHLPAAGDSRV
jgi:putative membrane protein